MGKGVFVQKVEIIPKEIFWNNKRIKFKEAWLEKQSKIEYSLLFFKREIIGTKDKLCFTLNDNDVINKSSRLFFVIGDSGKGVDMQLSGDSVVFETDIDINELSLIQMSLIDNWKQDRKKDITIKVRTTEKTKGST
jgi:hypothetical protein